MAGESGNTKYMQKETNRALMHADEEVRIFIEIQMLSMISNDFHSISD